MHGLGIRLIADELLSRLISKLRKNAKFVTHEGKEICVICHKETDVDFATNVSARTHYIEMGGQHCEKCCVTPELCSS